MACRLALLGEDAAHENIGRALISRCAAEEDVAVSLTVLSARFGIPRLRVELRAFQAVLARAGGVPDLLVVLVDANDVGFSARRREVEDQLDMSLLPAAVVGVPDPYVERWMLADPDSFASLFGVRPEVGRARTRSAWKRRLVSALEDAGQIVTQGGAEFADEVVEAMDLYRAGRHAPSLDAFVADLRAALRRMRATGAAG